MPKTKDELLAEKLDTLIRLLALLIASDRSVTDGVRALRLAGLDNSTIAKVLGTTNATVRTLASTTRGTR